MNLSSGPYHRGQDVGGDIRLMSIIIIVMAPPLYSVLLILTSIIRLLSYSLSLSFPPLLRLLSAEIVCTHTCFSYESVHAYM